MTSQLNLEDIYTELNNLLKDVCSFLTNEAQTGMLSAKAKNEAEKLVSRSRHQVDIVTKLSVFHETSHSNYPYLVMQKPAGVEEPLSEYVTPDITDYYEPQHYEESYVPADNKSNSSPEPSLTVNEDFCVHSDLPMSMIEEKSVKCGPLCRKERYLFIEQKKQYMVGLVGHWLLIYSLNKKDQKPIQIINLLNYTARSNEERKDPVFEIFAKNEKTHEFFARSGKDMQQWVVAINCKKHIYTNGRDLPELPQELNNSSDRNSNKINSDNDIMHYGSEECMYASVEDFGKLETPKLLNSPPTEDFPQLPPRSKELLSPRKKSTSDINTYNNLQKTETDDDDTGSEYDFVQCADTKEDKSNDEKEEPLEIYDELKVTETVNKNVKIPMFSNKNTTHDNYDNVDTGEEELEDYDTIKLKSKIPIKIDSFRKKNEQEDEDMVDYDELKPICQSNILQHTCLNGNQFQKDEELEDYDTIKPASPNNLNNQLQGTSLKDEELEDYDTIKPKSPNNLNNQVQVTSLEDEELEDYDTIKPRSPNNLNNQVQGTSLKDEELEDYDIIKPRSPNSLNNQVEITSLKNEELVNYDDLKIITKNDQPEPSQSKSTPKEERLRVYDKPISSKLTKNISKMFENKDETKPIKPMKPVKPAKKFWEKRTESPKKETDTDDDEPKRNVANLRTKLNVQPTTAPKPKSQTLLNKFPSFSKNRASKDEEGNSKVQNICQQLEHTLSFKPHK